MSGVNKIFILGQLGKSPEVKTIDNGAKVANFSVAVSEAYKDKNGNKVENTEWFNIVLWKGLAEIAEKYLSKGDQVFIIGKLRTRSWEKEGVTKYITEVIGNELTLLGGKKNSNGATVPAGHSEGPKDDTGDDSLPF